jgi:hypothetical protein
MVAMRDHPFSSSPLSWALGLSMVLSLSPRLRSLPRSVRGVCAGVLMMFALAQAIAEARLTEALSSMELSVKVWRALQADALFPFSPAIREVNASFALDADGIPPLIALMELRRALALSGNAPLLRQRLVLARLTYGDREGARESAEDFAQRFPHLPNSKLLLELTEIKP